MATPAQIRTRNWHRAVATYLGFGQSTIKHRALSGTISVPSATGVRVYTPAPATMDNEVTTDTLIWAIWKQKIPRTSAEDDLVAGKTTFVNWIGQFPVIDDNGAYFAYSDEDWLVDSEPASRRFKLQNMAIDPSLSFVTCEMQLLR